MLMLTSVFLGVSPVNRRTGQGSIPSCISIGRWYAYGLAETRRGNTIRTGECPQFHDSSSSSALASWRSAVSKPSVNQP
jgi:hypothetical protein